MEPSRNFDLRLSGTLAAVSVEVDSPAGQYTAPTALPCNVSPQALEDLRDAAPAVDLKAIGSALWRCAFGDPVVRGLWERNKPDPGSDGILRLRLVIDAAALAALPWELLYDETLGCFLALDGQTPVTRFTRLPISSAPWPQDRPLRLLFTGASPSDMLTLRVAQEWEGIEQMIAPLVKQGRLETPDLLFEGATLSSLLAALRRKVDIWHFAGHGTDSGLVFCKDRNRSNPVDAGELGQLLIGEGVRLAVINACRAGAGGGQAASVAGALLRAGIPSVVAMQANVSDAAADEFAGAFYDAIAVGQGVDQAMTAARKAIWATGTSEWWTPALFMRTPEGRIWRVPVKAETEARARELTYLEGVIEKYKYWEEKYTPLAGIAEVRIAGADSQQLDLPDPFIPTGFEKLVEHGYGMERRTERVTVDDLREAVAKYRRLVILGEPGSGKTTTLWRLAYDLANAAKQDPQAPMPLLVPLEAYSGPESAFVYAQGYFEELGPYLHTYLRSKRVILLLDALNQMPQIDRKDRVGRIQALLDQHPDVSVVVTCRALDYVETLKLEKLEIRSLEPVQQAVYLQRYLGEVEGENILLQMMGEKTQARWHDLRSDGLTWKQFVTGTTVPFSTVAAFYPKDVVELPRVIYKDSPLLALGRNPYMLVILAQVYKANKGVLPQNRGRLFAAFVDALLQREAKRCEPSIWPGADPLRHGMARLAYAMQEAGERGTAVDAGWAAEQMAQRGVDGDKMTYLCASATLLDISDSQVSFMHQLVQEYFAALALAEKLQKGDDLRQYWPKDWTQPSGWEETFVLLAGLLPDMTTLIEHLLSVNPVLAARCVAESGGEWPNAHTVHSIQHALVEIIASQPTSVRKRNAAGNALNYLGDIRPGIGLRSDGVPDIVWCHVPAGEFIMGSMDKREALWGQEVPQHRLALQAFSISKHLITNAQFDAFVQDGGYTDKWRHCWTKAGWRWKRDMLVPNKAGGMHDLPNHPVVLVTWYEAMAYANWLGQKLGRTAGLPSEAQWEKAARGIGGGRFPWKDDVLTPDHANFRETGIGTTSAVGIFPKGESHCGAQDMSGNVWEWCQTKWRDNYTTPADEDVEHVASRVVRGGSYDYDAGYMRSAVRVRYGPYDRYKDLGFRVVAAHF